MSTFPNDESIRSWVNKQSNEVIQVVAFRVAARVFPAIENLPLVGLSRLDLSVLRALLTLHAFIALPSADERQVESVVVNCSRSLIDISNKLLHGDAIDSRLSILTDKEEIFAADAASSACITLSNKNHIVDVINWSQHATRKISHGLSSIEEYFSTALESDLQALAAGISPHSLLQTPLWGNSKPPHVFIDLWERTRNRWSREILIWEFWIDWYNKIILGLPADLDKLKNVAQIPQSHWGDGPKAITREIERLSFQALNVAFVDGDQVEQKRNLYKTPTTNLMIANRFFEEIEEATNSYPWIFQTNQPPPAVLSLRSIAISALRIAEISQSSQRADELVEQLSLLVAQVSEMVDQLEDLKSQIERHRRRKIFDMAVETSVETSVKILTTGFWATVAASISHFTGVIDLATALDKISDFGSSAPNLLNDTPSIHPDTFDV